MKSFLEEIDDNPLVWSEDDDNDDVSFSSSTFSSSSDEEEEEEEEEEGHLENAQNGGLVAIPPPPLAGADHLDTNAVPPQAPMIIAANSNNEGDHQQNLPVQEPQQQEENEQEQHHQHQQQAEGVGNNVPLVAPIAHHQQPPTANIQHEIYAGRTNGGINSNLRNHPLSSSLLFRVARCEELPIIRAEIDWKLLQKQLPTYPAAQIGDELGAFLLQSVLRTDPPCEIIRDIIKLYPKSCVNMDSFYAACQYASDDAVQVLMRRTMKARKIEGITWGMLAFLGDARIRIRHAEFLLQSVPEALVDPMHGMFGVSPLDRMISGAFIHGGYGEWVGKLKLALWTAKNGCLNGLGSQPFFPFHTLIKRLVSSDFMGVQFGALSFVNSLTACIDAENSSEPPFHQMDQDGNLPLHIALQHVCDTNLGLSGERKLIKFLLNANPDSVMVRDENGKLPIVLAIENGWPAYDIIANACPIEYRQGSGSDKFIHRNVLIHDVLGCQYHQRYGVSGARSLIKFLLKKFPSTVELRDEDGRLPLHISLENGWPCHDILVAAAPAALEMKDPKSNFYPFQIASNADLQVKQNKNTTELSALYELIRWGPLLLKGIDEEPPISRGTKRKLVEDVSESCNKKICKC